MSELKQEIIQEDNRLFHIGLGSYTNYNKKCMKIIYEYEDQNRNKHEALILPETTIEEIYIILSSHIGKTLEEIYMKYELHCEDKNLLEYTLDTKVEDTKIIKSDSLITIREKYDIDTKYNISDKNALKITICGIKQEKIDIYLMPEMTFDNIIKIICSRYGYLPEYFYSYDKISHTYMKIARRYTLNYGKYEITNSKVKNIPEITNNSMMMIILRLH